MDITTLDNPAWSALTGRQAHLARGQGGVRRYRHSVSPFSAIEHPSALLELTEQLEPGETAVLWAPEVLKAPKGLEVLMCFPCQQMVAPDFRPAAMSLETQTLAPTDADQMLSLTGLTKPGPFEKETCLMGQYLGVRDGDALVAMAGERMKPEGFTEISAICVHPDHQGRGLARQLTSILGSRIVDSGRVPFLNVLPENLPAIRLYESLGFLPRRMMQVHIFQRPGGVAAMDGFFASL